MGKGGSSTEVVIPEWLEEAAKRNLGQADKISRLGSVPLSYGPTVADFTDAQYAGFNNTANTASAFGLNAPGAFSMGNPAATTYDNGVRALSAGPLFDAKMDAFAAARPAQKSYIDSFFIDPVSGQYGSNMAPLVDYGNFGTYADAVAAASGGGGSGAGVPVDSGPGIAGGSNFTTYGGHKDIAHKNLDEAFINYGKEITAGVAKPEDNPGYNADVAAANVNTPITFTTDDGNTVTKPAGELTSADFALASNDTATQAELAAATMLAAGVTSMDGGFNQNDPTTGLGGALTDFAGNIVENAANVPGIVGGIAGTIDAPNSTYDPTGGNTISVSSSNDDDPNSIFNTPSFAAGGSLQAETDLINSDMSDDDFFDMLENDPTVGAAVSRNDNDSGGGASSGGGGGGCVIATHAVAAGVYNYQTRREAEVWCMRRLHNKWWGEAIRRGYRYLGRQKIEQGKAHEHYQEFRDYIAFASGKKRTIKGAVHFAARTVQFFAVGLVKGDA